MTVETGMSLVS